MTDQTPAIDAAEIQDADIEKARKLIGADTAIRGREHITTATEDAIRNFAYGNGDDNRCM